MNAQGMTAALYAVGFLIVLLQSWHSDKTKDRGYHVMASSAMSVTGYIILATSVQKSVAYFALFLVIGGNHSLFPLIMYALYWPIPLRIWVPVTGAGLPMSSLPRQSVVLGLPLLSPLPIALVCEWLSVLQETSFWRAHPEQHLRYTSILRQGFTRDMVYLLGEFNQFWASLLSWLFPSLACSSSPSWRPLFYGLDLLIWTGGIRGSLPTCRRKKR